MSNQSNNQFREDLLMIAIGVVMIAVAVYLVTSSAAP